MRIHNRASGTMLVRSVNCYLFLPTRVCLDETDLVRVFETRMHRVPRANNSYMRHPAMRCTRVSSPLTQARLSMLKAKSPWRHARHLVEAPTEVALVGESSCEGDVNEREVCTRE
jgi:hypothetical protein